VRVLGQGAASLAAVAFFALCNAIPDKTDDACVLGGVCGALGLFLGYGLGAVCRSLGAPPGEDLDASLLRVPLFLVLVTIFHSVEFVFTVAFHPDDVSFRAFLLTPVPAGGYSIAMIAAVAEFWLETSLNGAGLPALLPRVAQLTTLWTSFALSLSGWALRTAALFTAQANFTHLVAWRRQASHSLVTCGVYSWCRHPGYVGWFVWSVSTQLVLGNLVCLVAYAAVAWKFFASRIPTEERLLVQFFGHEYVEYAHRVPCGLPGISDYS